MIQFKQIRAIIRHLLFTLFSGFALSSFTLPSYAADPTILLLGDSLSAAYGIEKQSGWATLLQNRLLQEKSNHLSQPYQFINASISGETSGGGLARLEPLLKQHQPQLLIVELGANDGLRGFPLKTLRNNLNNIVNLGKQYQAQVLMIGVQIPLNYGPRYTKMFEQIFTDISAQQKITLLPSLLGEIPLHKDLMQADGLHPNAQAQPMILERVWPVLQPLL